MARKTSAPSEDLPAPNKEEHEGDSGIGCSDAEMEPLDVSTAAGPSTRISTPVNVLQPALGLTTNQQHALHHILPRPPPLPLYQPPPNVPARAVPKAGRFVSMEPPGSSRANREQTPDNPAQRSVSIKSMLSHTPQA
ncbi:unnamed protein product [Aureobasidium mustum]|uniref:Uncharacterized protein n=1 Tax=Aureobasidium mustum TaxID=2773714 RepID=A0A9N8JLD6_9PEZI|nr:unnamed protein product [Aureobasidium mustum]